MLQAVTNTISELNVRGELIADYDLGAESWFRCGGKADLLFRPADEQDLQDFLTQYPKNAPLMILGGMANTIVRDGGIRGMVVQLGKNFADIKVEGTQIACGAGALNGSLSAAAMKVGLGGLEFFSGIPGSVGGALTMNAGAYGAEVKDVLIAAQAIDRDGKFYTLRPNMSSCGSSMSSCGLTAGSNNDAARDPAIKSQGDELLLNMTYRHTDLPEGMIFLSGLFEGKQESYEIVKARMNEIKAKRNESQPIKEKTGGSTFANPSSLELVQAGLEEGTRAWQLVDKVGGRGLKIGGAQISEKHCNFMINTGDASASDLEQLGDELIRRVHDKFGVTLRWEIKRVGEKP